MWERLPTLAIGEAVDAASAGIADAPAAAGCGAVRGALDADAVPYYQPRSARSAMRGLAIRSTTPTFHCVTIHRRTAGPKKRCLSDGCRPVGVDARYSWVSCVSLRHRSRRAAVTRYSPDAQPRAKAGRLGIEWSVVSYFPGNGRLNFTSTTTLFCAVLVSAVARIRAWYAWLIWVIDEG